MWDSTLDLENKKFFYGTLWVGPSGDKILILLSPDGPLDPAGLTQPHRSGFKRFMNSLKRIKP